MHKVILESTAEYKFLQQLGLLTTNTFEFDRLLVSYSIRPQFPNDKKKPRIFESKQEFVNCFDVKKAVKTALSAVAIGTVTLVNGIISVVSPITGIVTNVISSFLFKLIDANPRSKVTRDCALFYSYLVAYKHSFIDETEIVKEFRKFKVLAKKRYPKVNIITQDSFIVHKLLKFHMLRFNGHKYYLNKYLKFSSNNGIFDFSNEQ